MIPVFIYIVSDTSLFTPGDVIRSTSNPKVVYIVDRLYKPSWWRKALSWFGFKVWMNVIRLRQFTPSNPGIAYDKRLVNTGW